MIQVFSNSLGEEEVRAVERVFKTRWVGRGKECTEFERELARHLKTERVLLTSNCTAAIYLALRALGIGPGDEVIVSTVNFVACASAVVDMGAIPVFADVDSRTLNVLPSEIERLRTKKTKAVFLLHYGGHPCPMDEIRSACGNEMRIIEDSANSVSSSYKGEMCGTMGDAGVFSFDAMKILVMADGGALVLKNQELYPAAEAARYLGLAPKTTSGMDSLKEQKSRWWEYSLDTTSGRFISNDVLAAVGRLQLKKLRGFIARRKQVWELYQKTLSNVHSVTCPPEPVPGSESSYYLYWLWVERGRDELAAYLADNGVYTTFRYFPLHMVNRFRTGAGLPNAERANENVLNLPLHQNLSDEDVKQVCDLVTRFSA